MIKREIYNVGGNWRRRSRYWGVALLVCALLVDRAGRSLYYAAGSTQPLSFSLWLSWFWLRAGVRFVLIPVAAVLWLLNDAFFKRVNSFLLCAILASSFLLFVFDDYWEAFFNALRTRVDEVGASVLCDRVRAFAASYDSERLIHEAMVSGYYHGGDALFLLPLPRTIDFGFSLDPKCRRVMVLRNCEVVCVGICVGNRATVEGEIEVYVDTPDSVIHAIDDSESSEYFIPPCIWMHGSESE